jgi:hypothetical protein
MSLRRCLRKPWVWVHNAPVHRRIYDCSLPFGRDPGMVIRKLEQFPISRVHRQARCTWQWECGEIRLCFVSQLIIYLWHLWDRSPWCSVGNGLLNEIQRPVWRRTFKQRFRYYRAALPFVQLQVRTFTKMSPAWDILITPRPQLTPSNANGRLRSLVSEIPGGEKSITDLIRSWSWTGYAGG